MGSAGSASPRLQPSSPASTSPAPSPMAADGMPVVSSSALKTKFKAVGVIAAAVAAAPDAAVADDDNGSVSSVSSLRSKRWCRLGNHSGDGSAVGGQQGHGAREERCT